MLLIDPPSRRSWIIAIAGALMLVTVINALELYRMTQRGILTQAVGVMTIKKAGRNNIPIFNGEGKTGTCSFLGCNRDISAFNRKEVTVRLDEAGRIFEIIIAKKIYFGNAEIRQRRSNLLLRTLIFLTFSVFCLLFLPKNKK